MVVLSGLQVLHPNSQNSRVTVPQQLLYLRKTHKCSAFHAPWLVFQIFENNIYRGAEIYLDLLLSKRQSKISMQQSVLFHKHHTVFVRVPLCGSDQAAGGSRKKKTFVSVHIRSVRLSKRKEKLKTKLKDRISYFQQRGCSRPLTTSLVACRTHSRFQIRTFRAPETKSCYILHSH